MTAYHPEKKSISEILSTTNPVIVVPDWQRNYSWNTTHVETFWNDLEAFRESGKVQSGGEYFLGSIVIVKTKDGKHLLLDGQQRIATSVILLSVIRDWVRNYKADTATRTQQKFIADLDDATDTVVYKLTMNKYDREFFRRFISEDRTGGYTQPQPEFASHIAIKKARLFFEEVFKEKYANFEAKQAYDWSLSVRHSLLDGMTVISVSSEDEDSAADVFETLNDRGIGLSTPDLLRNLVIRRAPDAHRELVVDLWQRVIEFDSDSEIKNFLRHYWISHYGDVKTQSLYRVMKSYILLHDVSSKELAERISDSSDVYKTINDATAGTADANGYLETVKSLNANILLPALLAAFETFDEPEAEQATKAFLVLYVRHSVICARENSKLENEVYRMARELRTHKSLKRILQEIEAALPSDEDVTRSFETLSINTNAVRRYLLVEIEKMKRATEEVEVAAPQKVHVEHVYPQTPTDTVRLPQHAAYVNRLGNLSLLAQRINTSIKNGTFAQKKERYSGSDLLLTRELCQYEIWGVEEIEKRQKEMAKLVPKIWHIGD
ncbi:DUF262 domain-containing protein [Pseudooceanicola sp.]|uniref:DUF262 domain-containing protein n=1 Tax=Pseudooceanicola sp. TaxID=1914328 RepID=UPI0035175568